MNRLIGTLALMLLLLPAPLAQAKSSLVARVDLSAQTLTLSRNGRVVERWAVSTGKQGFRTPTGSYRPTRMHKMWHSRKYDMTPMPYSIFFRGGYAIHGTSAVKRLGRPASHGCVRLSPRNAAQLFAMVRSVGAKNTRIIITR